MSKGRYFASLIVIAGVSLSLAIAVYIYARTSPPEVFSPILATNPNLVSLTDYFGSAPSFFYTLSIGLVVGACASNRSNARIYCLFWIGLCVALEFTQLPSFSAMISTWLPEVLTEAGWRVFGPYWLRGIFDPIDLIATLAGGLIGMTFVTRLFSEEGYAISK